MGPLKRDLLTSCTHVAGCAESETSGAAVGQSADAVVRLGDTTQPLPSAQRGRTPQSPCAPPRDAMQPAIVPLQVLGVPPLQAAALIGGSRSTVYRLLAAEKLRAVKRGSSTIVLTESIHEYMSSLPPATFGSRGKGSGP
jgi:excisionase family DNA binding protein